MNNSVALVLGGYVNGYSIIRELYSCGVKNIWLFDYGKSLARQSNKIKGYSAIDKSEITLKNELLKLKEKFSYIVLFPTDDHQLEMLNKIYDDIADFCFLPFNRRHLEKSLDKNFQYEICNKFNIPFPKTKSIIQQGDIKTIYDLTFPLLIKPNKRDDATTSVFRSLYLDNEDDASKHEQTISEYLEQGISFLASEYVPGDDTNIYAYTAYRNNKGIVNEWGGKKLTQYPDLFGVFSSGSNVYPEVVKEQGRTLLNEMDLIGIAEPEFKFDVRDGKYKLMEINLRSMMWHRVGNLSGVQLQYSQWLDANGLEVPKQVQNQEKHIHLVYMKHEIYNLLSRKNYLNHFVFNVFKGKETSFSVFDRKDVRPFLYDLFYTIKGGTGICLRACFKKLSLK